MSDPLHHVLPADGQRTFEELREKFREVNRQRIRRMLRRDSLVRYHRDGTVAGRLETGLMTDAPEGRDWRTLRDFASQGGIVPEFRDGEEFLIPESAGLMREIGDLLRDAAALRLHEGVIYPEEDSPDDHGPEAITSCSHTAGDAARDASGERSSDGRDGTDSRPATRDHGADAPGVPAPWRETHRDGRPFADGAGEAADTTAAPTADDGAALAIYLDD